MAGHSAQPWTSSPWMPCCACYPYTLCTLCTTFHFDLAGPQFPLKGNVYRDSLAGFVADL